MALLRQGATRGNVLLGGGRDAWRVPQESATRRGRRAFSSQSPATPSDPDLRAVSAAVGAGSSVLAKATLSQAAKGRILEQKRDSQHAAMGSKTWMWSLLGAAVLGCGAVVAASTVHPATLAEGKRGKDDENKQQPQIPAVATEPVRLENVSLVGLPLDRSLRKRRSAGRDRLLISTAAVRGDRSRMEDTYFVSDCKRFSAVFDGHGGAAVSDYLQKHLFASISPGLTSLDRHVETANADKGVVYKTVRDLIQQAVEKVDAEVLARPDWKFQGSTAVGVMLYDEAIFSFNVGDSRAVMSRGGQTIELTHDHKPNDPIERMRIEKLGGTVKWYGYVDAQGDPIEPYGAYRVNGNLAVGRAIGDRDLRPYVCGDVEIKHFDRDFDKDEFIVIASDGLWDVFTSEEAVTFVHDVLSGELGGRESWRSGGHSDTSVPIFEWSHQYKSDRGMIKAARARRKTQIANYLVQEALFRGTSDNVSVIVVWLK